MIFPCLDCALCNVLAIHVRRDKLEGYLVFFEIFAKFFTASIVNNVKFRGVAIGLELEKSVFQLDVSSAAWRVLIGFERIKFES